MEIIFGSASAKKLDPATAAFWKFMWGIPDLFLRLPEDKAVDAFEERLKEFKTQWPDYPTPALDELLEAV